MSVLEQVSQMKSQGLQESEIITQLRDQGASPRQINDALNQSKIKEAVGGEAPQAPMPMPEEQTSEATHVPQTQEEGQQNYTPQPQEPYAPQSQEEYIPPQEIYQQQDYAYPQQEGYGTDTIIDVAEQVFAEKIKKIEKQINTLRETQNILATQVEHSTEKLKRIDSMLDKLQIAILEKIGSYGNNLETIKKEMTMIENSFTKIIPHAKKSSARKPSTKKKTSKKK